MPGGAAAPAAYLLLAAMSSSAEGGNLPWDIAQEMSCAVDGCEPAEKG